MKHKNDLLAKKPQSSLVGLWAHHSLNLSAIKLCFIAASIVFFFFLAIAYFTSLFFIFSIILPIDQGRAWPS